MKKCTMCGEDNDDLYEFCKKCGTPLVSVKPSFIPSKTPVPIPVSKPVMKAIEQPMPEDAETMALDISKSPIITPSVKTKTISNTTNIKARAIPFHGQIGGIGDIGPSNSCGAYMNPTDFNVRFQQRSDMELEISESLEKKDGVYSLLTIELPVLNKMVQSDAEVLLNSVEKLNPSPNNIENYPRDVFRKDDKIDFGYLVVSAPGLSIPDQANPNVIQLVSNANFEESLKQEHSFLSYKLSIDWNYIKKKLLEDAIIQHELFVREEEFQWGNPLSVKAEIEKPLVSLLKTVGVFDTNNTSFMSEIGIKDWLNKLPHDLKRFVFGKIWGGKNQDLLGLYPSIFNNMILATLRVIITNTTSLQVFNSALKNVELRIVFPKKFTELYQPSNLKVISPENTESYYDNETGILIWNPITIQIGESVVYEFQCVWDVINKLQNLKVEIRGEYASIAQFFDSFVYATPTGFPVKYDGSNLIWNSGTVNTDKGVYEVDQDIANHLDSKPSFMQTIVVDIERIECNPNTSLNNLEDSQEIVSKLKAFSESVGKFDRSKKDSKEEGN